MFSHHVTILFLPALGKDEVYYSNYFFLTSVTWTVMMAAFPLTRHSI